MACCTNAWATEQTQCRPEKEALPKQVEHSGEARLANGVTRIFADKVEGQSQNHARAEGRVTIERNDDVLNADWVEYNQKSDEIQAGGHIVLQRAGTQTIRGQHLNYHLGQQSGRAEQTEFETEHNGRRLQGKGGEIVLQDKQHYMVKDVQFNTCQAGDQSWHIKASELQANQESNIGSAKHARLVLGGVPILYTPWIDFPMNGNRKSGFLTPTLKIGSDGTQVELPYYLNLAPNYDATLTPGVTTGRGVSLGGEFRYLNPNYAGQIAGRYMPKDSKSEHQNRYELQFKHQHHLASNISAGVDINQVSDDDYYRDFYGRNDIAENVNLNRRAWVHYQNQFAGGMLHAHALVQKYQTLSDSQGQKDRPYAVMPRLSADWYKTVGNAYIDIKSEFVRFSHDSKQGGRRLTAYPSATWNWRNSWGYIRPKIGIHASHYWLEHSADSNLKNKSRILPIANIDAGIILERPVQVWGRESIQTLEPRLFYNYVRTEDQSNLPNFDSSLNTFNYGQLFRENLYSGQDRINASNSLSIGLQSRLLDRTNGLEYFRVGIGQKLYFSTDNVLLDGKLGRETRNRSDLVVFAGGQVGKNWYADTYWHYNDNARRSERFDSGIRYNPEAGKVLAMRFKYGRFEEIYSGFYDQLKHIDLAAQWPINSEFYAVGRLNYSLAPRAWLEQTAGFEYRNKCGCWSASVVAQRYVNDLGSYKNAVFFTLKLKDFSDLGSDPYEQLRLAIPGYSKTNEVFTK